MNNIKPSIKSMMNTLQKCNRLKLNERENAFINMISPLINNKQIQIANNGYAKVIEKMYKKVIS